MTQTSIEIDGFSHQNPIPAACRVGPLVETSIIAPFDPGERSVPEDLDQQIDNLFAHMGEILRAADADWRHVAKVTFFVGDLGVRSALNRPWLERYPNAEARPARHTQLAETSGPVKVSCVFTAYVDD